jgi:hypothetical protein
MPGYLAKRDWPARKAKLDAIYALMVADLGGYCGAKCDEELGCGSRSDLQLHHLNGKDWTANKVGPLKRMKLLLDDWLRDRLGVLCRQCNQLDGAKLQGFYADKKTQEVPF